VTRPTSSFKNQSKLRLFFETAPASAGSRGDDCRRSGDAEGGEQNRRPRDLYSDHLLS
jgi:hypothetical protein